MRLSVTLDEDVAMLLREQARAAGLSISVAANHYLRLGLAQSLAPRKRFVVRPLSVRLPPGLSYDSISQLLEDLEGPMHR